LNSFAPSAPVPVAIIGMGCLFPRAEDLKRYWANILDRVDAITEVPESHWRADDYHDPDPKARDRTYSRRGGFLSAVDFPPLDFGIAPHSIEATDTTQLLGLLIARAALADAGYDGDRDFNRERVSVILGVSGTLELVIPLSARLGEPVWRRALADSGISGQAADAVVERIASSYVGWQENSFPGLLGNVAAGRIANRLDLRGTNCVVDAACASSLGALELALLELAVGRCDLAVTGGIDTFNDIFVYMCFSKTPALSPSGEARPFDAEADGTILGEGLGMLVLKRLDDARRDGDRIYAVIRSIGSSSDGKGQAVYAPSAAGQVLALSRAYNQAGIAPRTVELVEAHGTGTRVGDSTELEALEEVYGAAADGGPWCALGSVKSQIGHTKAAAGAAGLIKAALALHHKVLPPTTKVERPLEPLAAGRSPFYLNTEARPWFSQTGGPRRAAVSAFGFGGSNFHCVLEEAGPEKSEVDWDGDVQILALSGDEPGQLLDQLEALEGLSDWTEIRDAASRTRQAFRHDRSRRLVFVARRDHTDWPALVAAARARLDAGEADSRGVAAKNGQLAPARDKESVFCRTGAPSGQLAFLFPGQGSQYAGMLRELACRFPRMQQAIALANSLCKPGEPPVSTRIYPCPVFTDHERRQQEQVLRETGSAQRAIGSVSLGLLAILEQFGVRPDLVGGHSFGELVALRAAGRLDDASLALLAARRGDLMAAAAAGEDAGAMLAVFTGCNDVASVIEDNALDLVIANKNAPRQCVLSGPAAEIERGRGLFAARQIATAPIGVSRAFHSRLVAGAVDSFLSVLESVDFASSPVPVFANTTGLPYPVDPSSARALLAGQLARPVEFVAQIEAMYRMGARTFVEVGPDAKLTALVRAILEGKDHQAIAVDASRGAMGNIHDLACTLAALAAQGYALDLTGWDGAYEPAPAKRPGLTVKICGANARPQAAPAERAVPSTVALAFEPVDAAAHAPITSRAPSVHEPALPRASAPTEGIVVALENARQSLVALEKLAEQTAELHRQFLEGQAKTQQSFLQLLEHEQRLSWALIGAPAESTRLAVDGHARAARQEPRPPESAHGHVPESASPPAPPSTNGLAPARMVLLEAPGSDATKPEPVSPAASAPSLVPRGNGSIAGIVIDVVSEKTGYPEEVLELDMQLDADLGIDSIKRVEILSALQDRLPSLPSIPPEVLGKLRSLRSIVEAISDPVASNGEPTEAANASQDLPVNGAPGEMARVLVETVALKTGYPAEMLELEMRLDTDLGIDSIKRVEIFSAIQDRLPGMRAAGPEEIGTLGTLRDIVAFLEGRVPAVAEAHGPPPAAARSGAPASATIEEILLESVAEKTGVPIDMPELDMQLDVDLGIDSANGFESTAGLVLRTLHPLARPLDLPDGREEIALRGGGIVWISDDGSPLAAAVERRLTERGYKAKVLGPGEVRSPSPGERLCGLIVLAPRDGSDHGLVTIAFRLMRAAAPALEESAARGGASLLTVSRLDGAFGLSGLGSAAGPISGALAGLAKTAACEWPSVNCKAMDVDAAFDVPEGAARVIVEEFLKRGPLEVGLSRLGRTVVELESLANEEATQRRARPLAPGEVLVIAGGGRGVTAEVAVALASAFQPRLVLLGRSPAPSREEEWVASIADEAELKRALAARSGRRPSPHELGQESRRILAGREIRRNLERIKGAGAAVVYESVDVRDGAAVQAVMARVHREFGPVRGLIHGAGVLADRRIIDQTDPQFDLVYHTKVLGLHNLFSALDPEALKLLVLFSSSTARFGRVGQVAYAAANEYLNKWAQQQSLRLPQCRVVSFNWGPWAGGMVTDALKPMFEQEGLALIPLDAGARLVVEEARREASRGVELVVAAAPAPIPTTARSKPATTTSRADREPLATVFRRDVDLESVPVLTSHVIDSHPVLPVALILEWMAEAALDRNPGLSILGVDDFRLFKGVILGHQKPATVELLAGKPVRRAAQFTVPVELSGALATGKAVAHARAVVVLGDRLLASSPRLGEPVLARHAMSREEIYQTVLFHGPQMQGIESVEGCGECGIVGWVSSAPGASEWIDRPSRGKWLIDPLAIDSAFQLVGLWTRAKVGSNSLPTGIGSLRLFQREFPEQGVRAIVEIGQSGAARAVANIELVDQSGRLVARLDNFECVIDASLNQAFRRNRLSSQFSVVSR
jgi:acyl transferase domain-containing protein/NAD(P)-dependent dehydrogenase (short-subunit alcohol dehydrogenase family)/acyl carrier protein